MKKILFLNIAFLVHPFITYAGQPQPNIVVPSNATAFIHILVICQDLKGIKKVIKEKPNSLHMTDEKGNTPLHLAVQKNFTDIVNYLIEQARETEGKQLLFYLTQKNALGKTILDLAPDQKLKKLLNKKIKEAAALLIDGSWQKERLTKKQKTKKKHKKNGSLNQKKALKKRKLI